MFARDGIFCRVLFSLLFTASFSTTKLDTIQKCSDAIGFIMIFSEFLENSILWSHSPHSLSKLLEIGFWIDIKSILEDMRERRIHMFHEKTTSHFHSPIEIECSDKRLESVRQNIRIHVASCNRFSSRELDSMGES